MWAIHVESVLFADAPLEDYDKRCKLVLVEKAQPAEA
jgi:hypothetical protein